MTVPPASAPPAVGATGGWLATARLVRRLVAGSAGRLLAEPGAVLAVAGVYPGVTLVLGSLWWAAAGASGGAVAGYRAVALVWYAALAEAAVIPANPKLIEDIGSDITAGRLEVELLRPRSVLLVRVASEIGVALARAAVCLVLGLALVWAAVGPPPNLVALGLAVPSLVLGVVLNVVVQHGVAGTAFWARDATSAWFLYQKMLFLLGGMLLPLQVLPPWLATVARLSPFPAMVYVPARLAAGHLEPHLLLAQAGWLVAAWVVAHRLFARGERRLTGAGP